MSTRRVNASVTGANASAQATIAGAVIPGPTAGSILGVVAATTTSCDASATFGISSSAAVAGTDPFVLEPLLQETKALVHVDLVSNLLSDPDAGLGLRAFGSGADALHKAISKL